MLIAKRRSGTDVILAPPAGVYNMFEFLPTAYVVRGKVMFSVCSHLEGGVPQPGPMRGVPLLPGLTGGTPARGYPTSGTPHQTWLGVPRWGIPHLRYPPSQTWLGGTPHWVPPKSDLARVPQQGVPNGGTPPQVHPPPPHQTWPGGYPDGGTPPHTG